MLKLGAEHHVIKKVYVKPATDMAQGEGRTHKTNGL